MDKQYQNLIFTNHSLDRLKLRSVSQETVRQVLAHPDQTYPTDKPNSHKFVRHIHNRQIQVVATYLSNQNKWLIISVWVRGEEDPQSLVWQLLAQLGWLLKKIVVGMWKLIRTK